MVRIYREIEAEIQKVVLTGRQRLVWVMLALSLLSLSACNNPVPSASPQLVEGQAFPSFMLNYVLGDNATKQTFQGKVLILNVWATWCPPCRKEMPSLEYLSKTLDPKRFAVIGLSTDEDALLATEFLVQGGITFSNFFDQNGNMARQLGLKAYPETFLIAQDGTLVRRVTGLQDWSSPEMLALLEHIYETKRGADVRN